MTLKIPKYNKQRKITQHAMLPVVLFTIGLGWKYPLLCFSVPLVMAVGALTGIFRGRFMCGNFCPRGSFFDRMASSWSQKKTIPAWMRDLRVRWSVFAGLMGLMVFRLSLQPFSVAYWGLVFWQLCVITTIIGIGLGLIYHPRTWCAFCPIGTLQNALGGDKQFLTIDAETCRSCGLCEKKCPFALDIVPHKEAGKIANRDCLKCSECVHVCPTRSLAWSSENA